MPDLNQHLAAAVLGRRRECGWSQADVYANGGPSDTTQGKIESGRGAVGPRTLTQLDVALRWEPGTAAQILAKGQARLRHPSRPGRHVAELEEWATAEELGSPPEGLLQLFDDDDLLDEVRRRMQGGSDAGTTREKRPSPGEPGNVRPLTPREERRQWMIEQGMPVETAADRDRDEPGDRP